MKTKMLTIFFVLLLSVAAIIPIVDAGIRRSKKKLPHTSIVTEDLYGPAVPYASRYAFGFNSQRQTFYAAGLYWVFYADAYTGKIVYKTSTNGLVWSSETTIDLATTTGNAFSLWYDGTYVYYVCSVGQSFSGARYWPLEMLTVTPESTGTLTYRVYTPNSDGTLTTVVDTNLGITAKYPIISVDSNGLPWIGYTNNIDAPTLIRSTTTPNWTTDAGNVDLVNSRGTYPWGISTPGIGPWIVDPIPLANEKMCILVEGYSDSLIFPQYLIGSCIYTPATGFSTTPAVFYSTELYPVGLTTGYPGNQFPTIYNNYYPASVYFSHTAIAVNDDVYLAFQLYNKNTGTANTLAFCKRTYGASPAWGGITILDTGSDNYPMWMQMSKANGNVLLFRKSFDNPNSIGFDSWKNGAYLGWSDIVTDNYSVARVQAYYNAYGNRKYNSVAWLAEKDLLKVDVKCLTEAFNLLPLVYHHYRAL